MNLVKYDELTNSDEKLVTPPLDPSINKHNFVVDSGLTFRIDDFISEVDDYSSQSLGVVTGGGSEDFVAGDDDDDVPGLGIDVDVILNSDKFTNFLLSPKNNTNNLGNSNANNQSDMTVDGNIKRMYKFIPKYATVDKLIDLLLLDSRYFHRDVHLDMTEYRFVFC